MSTKSVMSPELKSEIARQLGVSDKVSKDGWGAVSSRDCGRMVSKAIEMAGKNLGAR